MYHWQPTCKYGACSVLPQFYVFMMLYYDLINPLRMCKRVTIVCLYCICYYSTRFAISLYCPEMVHTANIRQSLGFQLTDFVKSVLLRDMALFAYHNNLCLSLLIASTLAVNEDEKEHFHRSRYCRQRDSWPLYLKELCTVS